MAYFYNSNYSKNHDNYQYYDQNYYSNYDPRYVQQYSNTEFYGNAYQYATTPSLVGYYYSSYNNQPEFYASKNANSQENDEYYYDHVSTQYVVSYNSTTVQEADEVVEKEDVPKTFHGGYDINEKYGKPLPPSDEICYPHSKYDPKIPASGDVNFESIPSPYLKEDEEVVSEGEPKKGGDSEVIREENASDFEEDEDDEDYNEEDDSDEEDDSAKEPSHIAPIVPLVGVLPTKEVEKFEGEAKAKDSSIGEVIQSGKGEGKGNLDEPNSKNWSIGEVIQEEKALELEEDESEGEGEGEGERRIDDDYGNQVRRQIPPGYGMEAYDICEGLFGGYFPCLWKRNQRIYNHQRDVNEEMSDYDYCWKESADFLFGNPNPYGGTMPEKGSYGDPVYSYHRHYPQQPVTRQVENYGTNYSSYLQNTGSFYGHGGDY